MTAWKQHIQKHTTVYISTHKYISRHTVEKSYICDVYCLFYDKSAFSIKDAVGKLLVTCMHL